MDLHEIQAQVAVLLREASQTFQKVPGSAVLIRYVQASYQNDPIRSIFELFLLIFFIRYLLSPSYATNDSNYVKLSEDEIEELVEEWQPEPLVGSQTTTEELEMEKLPVIVGYVSLCVRRRLTTKAELTRPGQPTVQLVPKSNWQTAVPSRIWPPTTCTTSTQMSRSKRKPSLPFAPTASVPAGLRSFTEHKTST